MKDSSRKGAIPVPRRPSRKASSYRIFRASVVLITEKPSLLARIRAILRSSAEVRSLSAPARSNRPTLEPLSNFYFLLDLTVPDALSVFGDLRRASPAKPIILLSRRSLESLGLQLLLAGAAACLDIQSELFRLPRCLRIIASGGTPLSPRVASQLLRYARAHQGGLDQMPLRVRLSDREVQVLSHLAAGLLYKEIASQMGITYQTVCSYVKRVYQKLDVRSRAEAVLKLRQVNL